MELFLIRHAQSENNARPKSQRVADPGITNLGREQAARLAQSIHAFELTQLYTSPFLRTLETARAICRDTRLVPHIKIELHELGGCYRGFLPEEKAGEPGMNGDQIRAAFPAFEFASNIGATGWWESKPYEVVDIARQRAQTLLDWTREQFGNTQERIAYVTHADITELLLTLVHEEPLPSVYNTSVTALRITAHETRLIEFNDVAHLTGDMLSV